MGVTVGLVVILMATADPCQARVPESLRASVAKQYPAYRLPVAADTDPGVLARVAGASGPSSACVLVAAGDVDGDGREDVALLLPEREGKKTLLVVALRAAAGWRVSTLFEHEADRPQLYVQAVPAHRTYTQSAVFAANNPGFEPRLPAVERLTPEHTGLASGVAEASEICFFLVKNEWLRVYTST